MIKLTVSNDFDGEEIWPSFISLEWSLFREDCKRLIIKRTSSVRAALDNERLDRSNYEIAYG